MNRGTVARIEDWETSPVPGGDDGLRDLADADFSGAVTAGGAWLFMLNGRVIGVVDGSLEGFSGADATAYVAPHPSLPLLFAMHALGGEVRGRYYTDDTPLEEVDRTLSEGKFTGYVELSENVLSGDYYVVYYGGEALSAAYVGAEERLVTGEEAFDLANDEVGIYEVRTVDLEVREVPDAGARAAGSSAESGAGAVAPRPDEPPTDDAGEHPEPSTGRETGTASDAAGDPGPAVGDSEPATTDPETSAAESESATADTDVATGDARTASSSEDATADSDAAGTGASRTGSKRSPAEQSGGQERSAGTERTAADADDAPTDHSTAPRSSTAEGTATPSQEADGEDPFSEEEEWREARTIPALDPDESAEPVESAPAETDREPEPRETVEGESTRPDDGPDAEAVGELRAELEATEGRIAELEERLGTATDERDELKAERDSLRRRVSELESEDGDDADVGERLDPEDALTGTDVFVRYGSKGKATLEAARDAGAERDSVNENLRLETHTRFEEEAVAVDGRPFHDFLDDTLEQRFVRWIAEDLLYEIRDTKNEGGLRNLYDAIPRIDRIEYHGSIATSDEDGEEIDVPFDVILRDRMGSPLIVADLNDARDPATSDMMSELIERATTVADAHDSLGSAFLVTASFFEPDALETASDATDVGLLNRDARKSFVKMSRKQGYHLCLVEARGNEFHVAVPEL